MKNLIIIGAGGMGRTIFDMAIENAGHKRDYLIKGFIDDNLNALDGFPNYPPIIGTIQGYQVESNDVFICSIGGSSRRTCMEIIIKKGGEFLTLIHPSSRIGTNVHIGKGCYIGAFTIVAADAFIDDFNFIQSHTIIGHDVKIGKWNRIDSFVFFVGGTSIGEGCIVHTRAMINHEVVVGNNVLIGACSLVLNNVDDNTTVFGVPARRIK